MTWKNSYPTTENTIKEISKILQDNFDVIENTYELEHYSPASANAAPGTHRLGTIGAIYEGTTIEIAALSAIAASGALAYDTTLGVLVRYTGTSWTRIGSTYWSRMRAYLSSTVAVTAGASATTLVCDTEDYDTLGEYNNATGIFTTLASGCYLITAQVAMTASGSQTTTAVMSATGNVDVSWIPYGASTNYQAIDNYPTPNDSEFNSTQVSGDLDIFSGTLPSIPEASEPINISVAFRGRRRGCVCDNTCYGQACTCNNTCYGQACTCNNTCYGYSQCSCNYMDYEGPKGCECYYACYGYAPCSCYVTCYGYTCSCNATVYGESGCSCDNMCYSEDLTRPAAVIRKGGIDYAGVTTVLTSAFSNYSEIWENDPSTGLPWTTEALTGIQGFGYKAVEGVVGCFADISQCYLQLGWFPSRPVIGVHIYINDALYQSSYRPIHEPGVASYQTANIFSIILLKAGDTLKIAYTKTMENDTIYGLSALTYTAIHRLPLDSL